MDPRPTERSASEQEILRDIFNVATKVRDNAEQLFCEAKLLGSAGALSRALFLHQISLEECAKVDMLGAWAVSHLTGMTPDDKKFSKALASHKAKNYANAYMLEPTEAEKRAREAGDWRAAIETFEKTKVEFHEKSNAAKNAALYVDVQHGVCSTPSEHTTEAMVEEISNRNEEFLAHANNHVLVLSRWQDSAAEFAELARWFVERAEELRDAQRESPEEAMATLMAEAFQKLRELPVNKKTLAQFSAPHGRREAEGAPERKRDA
jgi:AbiV family abortive infection protein